MQIQNNNTKKEEISTPLLPQDEFDEVVRSNKSKEVIVVMDQTTTTEQSKKPTLSHDSILASLLTELKPINFREEAKLSVGESLSHKHYLIITIQEILKVAKRNHWALCIANKMAYAFNGEYWKQLSKDEIESFLGKAAEKLGVNEFDAKYFAFKENLLKQFFSEAYLPQPKAKSEEIKINFLNGTFVISELSQDLKEFDSKDFMTYQLPFSFDQYADAPLFHAYLNEVLPDEKQRMVLAEYMGYIFIKKKVLKLEKTLILYGSGANGKSVFFEIITALLGKENMSSYSLQSLTNDTGYYRAKLNNKLLNYASEISPQMNSTIFKQLVSGEPIEARLPYGEPFTIDDYAKLVFNTNELPRDVEQNEAFYRRFLIMKFGVTIPEERRDPELAGKIIDAELAGVFNWIMEGLERLLKQKRFTHCALIEDAVKNYKEQSDSVHLFITELGYVKDVLKETALKSMFDEYKSFCSESCYKPCSSKVFNERIRNQGFTIHRKNIGNVVHGYKKGFDEPTLGALASQSEGGVESVG